MLSITLSSEEELANNMDAYKGLKKLFPDVNTETTLKFLGPSQRIKIGRATIELKPYDLGDGHFIMAAFVPEVNTIFMRFAAMVDNPSDG